MYKRCSLNLTFFPISRNYNERKPWMRDIDVSKISSCQFENIPQLNPNTLKGVSVFQLQKFLKQYAISVENKTNIIPADT